MSKRLSTVNIGIPAYDEEANIYYLLKSIISQKVSEGILEKIIVISDGSEDQTLDQARRIKDKRLLIINNKKRQGKMVVQNEILEIANSDILIMLDADTVLNGKNFVDEIIKPFLKDDKVGIVGAETISLTGRTFLERVIARSHEFKKNMYKRINNGNNIYLCHGRARAFLKDFYKSFKWPNESPEDAFSYLACIKNNFKFKYSPSAKIKFRSPSLLTDHRKQSNRFREGRKNLLRHFNEDFVRSEYNIPIILTVREIFWAMIKSPILMSSYLCLYFYLILSSKNETINFSKWDIAQSSKSVR